jgi:NTP pyrophosphatase (non-canonical NTP hydrolase)
VENILNNIIEERKRQDEKWGIRDQHPCVWLTILSEEIGEIAKEICDSGFKTDNLGDNYRNELIQSAAVLVAMIQNFDNEKEKNK